MLTDADTQQAREKGIPPEELRRQLNLFANGVTVPKLIQPCTVGRGIIRLDAAGRQAAMDAFQQFSEKNQIIKFVPASGAATRMFKALSALYHDNDKPSGADAAVLEKFYAHLSQFAFYPALAEAARRAGTPLETLLAEKRHQKILELLLTNKGLGLEGLPKGLIPFHRYKDQSQTAFAEHLAEAQELLGERGGSCRVHFTVAPEHQHRVAEHIQAAAGDHAATVDFSTQHPATDTIAADMDNTPFRDENGRLVFRPGGHGALLSNINELAAEIVFIKNIDNVAIAPVRQAHTGDLQVLCGLLIHQRQRMVDFLRNLDPTNPDPDTVAEIQAFVETDLQMEPSASLRQGSLAEQVNMLRRILDRPLRVCGVVKHAGEPGGGPFLVQDSHGRRSPQIIEQAQVDISDPEQKKIWESSTHFNPVIMAASLYDHTGRPYDLRRFADPSAGIITEKSRNGRTLKALEHPGLWNGSMADWNTIFVELPAAVFTPVKTVFDLLRDGHLQDIAR